VVGEYISLLLSALCIHLPPRLSATPSSRRRGIADTTDLSGSLYYLVK
jgi:hypothetical protein